MKKTEQNTGGCSYFGHVVEMTPTQLRAIVAHFGAGITDENHGHDKTNIDTEFETDGGELFTVYDYRVGRALGDNEVVRFHIGAHNSDAANSGAIELRAVLAEMTGA